MNDYPADIAQKAREIVAEWNVRDFSGGTMASMVASAISEERQRCARIAEHLNGWGSDCGRGGHAEHIAAAIRSGGE